jgi:PAS domain S-box-containing protein
MRKEVSLLEENITELAREAALVMKDQINFSLEQFTEKELRDFFKSTLSDLTDDLIDDTSERLKKGLLRSADFFSGLRIDERQRLLLTVKNVVLKMLASLTLHAAPTALRVSQLIDESLIEIAYHYEIEMMKSETSDVLIADEIADELYKTRKKLEQQKKFITSLLENSPDAIALLDARKKILMWNSAATELFGYKQVQLIGKSLEKLAEDDSLIRTVIREAEKKDKVFGAELPMQHQDQRVLPVSLSISTIDSASEREANFLVVMRDASELRQMRDQVIDAERLSAMAKIAGAVAHEVRNPLNSISLNLDLLEDELPDDASERLLRQIKVFREEIEKLSAIVTNYLSLSRLNKTDFKIVPMTEILDATIEKIKITSADLLAEHHRKLMIRRKFESEPTPFLVQLDENQFSRVLLNLLQNAIESAMSREKRIEIEVALFRKNTNLILEITDNGEGISDETREKLFTPFFSTKSGGTGLGLYIVREIIENHRGDIDIKNRADGKGATVRVSLPLAEQTDQPSLIED